MASGTAGQTASVQVKEEAVRAASGNGKASPEDPAAGNLDKVRDILFGAQVRDAERRFTRLEERIAHETAALSDDIRKRLGVLEQFVKDEVESLAQRLSAEHQARTDADKDLSRELRDSSTAVEKKFGQVDDQVARVQRDLRQQLLDVQQKLSDDIRQQAQDSLARLARESSELRSDKVDRSALAAMLNDLAMRLTGDPTAGADGD
jgi:seryl-tRNA synthetase